MNLRTLVVLLVCIPSSAALAYWLGARLGGSAEQPPYVVLGGLAVEQAALDIGEVWEQTDFLHDLSIANRTASQVEIRDFQASCACVAIEPRSVTIDPGKAVGLRLKLDLARRNLDEIGQAERTLSVELRPIRNDIAQPRQGWLLRGVIKSRVTLDALAVYFGEEAIHGQSPYWRKVVATVHQPDVRLEANADGDPVLLQVKRRADPPNQYELMIAPSPELKPGPFEGKVQVGVVTGGGQSLYGATLPFSGTMQPEVRALPARLFLGARRVGGLAEATVTLQVPKGQRWLVDHVEAQSPDVEIQAIPEAPGSSGPAFRIRQRVTKEGKQSSVVRFFVRQPGRELAPLTTEVI